MYVCTSSRAQYRGTQKRYRRISNICTVFPFAYEIRIGARVAGQGLRMRRKMFEIIFHSSKGMLIIIFLFCFNLNFVYRKLKHVFQNLIIHFGGRIYMVSGAFSITSENSLSYLVSFIIRFGSMLILILYSNYENLSTIILFHIIITFLCH